MGLRIGRYETVKAIASGGMATVYLGRALGAGGFERLVGIKMMHPHIATDPEFVSMFLDEARIAARVRHPNVVATIDVQESEHGLALVMEYVEGPSLYAIIRKLGKGPERVIPRPIMLRIFIDALMGLHAAHELTDARGVSLELIHRDVSPQNVLVGVDGISKITDFGVARASTRLTSTRGGQLKGKLAYMSPEQMKNETIDRRSDVYASGILLWELLTGLRMFHGESEGALVLAVLGGAKQPPSAIAPSVPKAIDKVCMRAIDKDVNKRYPTALAFAEALEDAATLSGVSIATPRAVTAFVMETQAHERPDLSEMEDEPSHDQPAVSVPPRSASLSASHVTGPTRTTPAQEVAISTDDVASVALTRMGPLPRTARSRIAVFAAIGGGALLGALLLVKALGGGGDHTVPTSAGAAETSVVAAVTAPPPPASAVPSTVVAVAPSASVASSASSASITAPVPGPMPTAINTSQKGGPRRSGPMPGKSTAFRPSDL